MSAKIGRPPVDNPKSNRVTIRMDNETMLILDKYCKDNSIDKATAIRNLIKTGTQKIK